MSSHVLRAAAVAAALLSAHWAAATPLSLDQALDLAVQRSQLARAARAGATGAAEMARAAGQLPDPMLAVGVDNLPATGPDRLRTSAEAMTMKRIGIAQEWVPADKRAARESVAHAFARRESVTGHVAAAEVRLQTALAYIDAYYAGQALELTTLNEKACPRRTRGRQGASGDGLRQQRRGPRPCRCRRCTAEDESADQRQQQGSRSSSAAALDWCMPVDGLSEPRTAVLPRAGRVRRCTPGRRDQAARHRGRPPGSHCGHA